MLIRDDHDIRRMVDRSDGVRQCVVHFRDGVTVVEILVLDGLYQNVEVQDARVVLAGR